MKVKLLRPMCFGGVRFEVGALKDVPDLLARELLAQGRAEAAGGEKLPPAGPMTTETAAVLTASPAKGKTNARS